MKSYEQNRNLEGYKKIKSPTKTVPSGPKWVFKEAEDDQIRTCMVAWGYTQITGV